MTRHGYALSPHEGTAYWFLGTRMTAKVDGETSGGAFTLIDQECPTAFATPAHIHEVDDEAFYVLEGLCASPTGRKSGRSEPEASSSCRKGSATASRSSAVLPPGSSRSPRRRDSSTSPPMPASRRPRQDFPAPAPSTSTGWLRPPLAMGTASSRQPMNEDGFRQVLLLRWSPEVEAGARTRTLAAALALPEEAAEVLRVEVAEGSGFEDTWDAVIVMDFADESAWRRYLDHPAHRAFVADHSLPTIAERAVIHHRVGDIMRSGPSFTTGSGTSCAAARTDNQR